MKRKTNQIICLSMMVVGLAACNQSKNKSGGQTEAPNQALTLANAEANSDPEIFDPLVMSVELAGIVGSGTKGEPVSIGESDTVSSVLERLSN